MADPLVVKSMVIRYISRVDYKYAQTTTYVKQKKCKKLKKSLFSKSPPNRWIYPDNKVCIKSP
jgi:hypothetical protein